MQQFTVNNTSFSRLANGHLAKHGKGICPNGCLAPQYDNDMCSNEIFMGKHYRSCPWVSDGRIDNTACNDCGAILIQKINLVMQELDPDFLMICHLKWHWKAVTR